MMQLVLSGTAGLVLSGTESSYYQEPKWPSNPLCEPCSGALNLANKESFGFLLTQARLWTGVGFPQCGDWRRSTHDLPHKAETGFRLIVDWRTSQSPLQGKTTTGGNASPNAPGANRRGDGQPLTHVSLIWREGRQEDWLKFGKPVAGRIVDRRQRIESYAAGQVFALVLWAANEYGTIRSTLEIVRAVRAGEPCTPVAQVDPGGELLLSVKGWPKVAQVFRLIDAIEASGIDPCEVAPDHWRHIHNRLTAHEPARGYSSTRHRAWLKRKALLP